MQFSSGLIQPLSGWVYFLRKYKIWFLHIKQKDPLMPHSWYHGCMVNLTWRRKEPGISSHDTDLIVLKYSYFWTSMIDTFQPIQHGRRHFKFVFANEGYFLLFEISMKLVPYIVIGNMRSLVRIMAWFISTYMYLHAQWVNQQNRKIPNYEYLWVKLATTLQTIFTKSMELWRNVLGLYERYCGALLTLNGYVND